MSQFENLEYMFLDGAGEFDFPEIKPIYEVPNLDSWIEFDYAIRTKKDRDKTGIHFFSFDGKFTRVWNYPKKYLNLLQQFGCVIMPDFSAYKDFSKAVQIWNKYRNHWLAAYWQMNGMTVIPQIMWSDETTYDWIFDAYPKHSVVAVSSVGCMREKEAKRLFYKGWEEMLKRLEPSEIMYFSNRIDKNLEGNIHFISYSMDKGRQL